MVTDPKLTVKNLLKGNWNSANTSNVTPQFSTGWWDETTNAPQVTITNRQPVAAGGGETGYNALDGSGGTPHQTVLGSVDVNFWAHRDDGSGENPKKLLHKFSEEAVRIVRANYNSATDLRFVSISPEPLDTVEAGSDGTPALYRHFHEVRYGYFRG